MEVCKGLTALVSTQKAANWFKRNSLTVRHVFAKLHAVNFVVEQNIFGLSSRLKEGENICISTAYLSVFICVSSNKILYLSAE